MSLKPSTRGYTSSSSVCKHEQPNRSVSIRLVKGESFEVVRRWDHLSIQGPQGGSVIFTKWNGQTKDSRRIVALFMQHLRRYCLLLLSLLSNILQEARPLPETLYACASPGCDGAKTDANPCIERIQAKEAKGKGTTHRAYLQQRVLAEVRILLPQLRQEVTAKGDKQI